MQGLTRQQLVHIKIQPSSFAKIFASPIKQKYKQQGISLIEIIVVVTILAIIAVVVVPDLSSNDYRKLDLAAEELAQAIRFSRLESMRTKTPHGVIFNASSDNAKVYRLPSFFPIYDVYHPVNKRLYTLNLKTDNATAGVGLQSYAIYYTNSTTSNSQYLGFNIEGNPKLSFFGTDYMLVSAAITLEYAGKTKVINVSPMTGRVTVQ